ncbi:MAG TPA: hypothetical protein DD646_01505, partial [Acidimicrobiaceae bacterium]|nr:hypothetical protein [Acidimicrobiaceae bacterium]
AGVLRCVIRPAKGGVIELVSPIDGSQGPARELESVLVSKGEGIFALELAANEEVSRRDFEIFGTRFWISE